MGGRRPVGGKSQHFLAPRPAFGPLGTCTPICTYVLCYYPGRSLSHARRRPAKATSPAAHSDGPALKGQHIASAKKQQEQEERSAILVKCARMGHADKELLTWLFLRPENPRDHHWDSHP